MSHEPNIVAAYFGCAFYPKNMQKLIHHMKRLMGNEEFDTIAFRGMSGAVVAPVVAHAMQKHLLVVRKPKIHSDEHHSHLTVEGNLGCQRYIIIDDVRATGNTIAAILGEVREWVPEARCIGAVLYHEFLSYNTPLALRATQEMYRMPDVSIFSGLPNPEWDETVILRCDLDPDSPVDTPPCELTAEMPF